MRNSNRSVFIFVTTVAFASFAIVAFDNAAVAQQPAKQAAPAKAAPPPQAAPAPEPMKQIALTDKQIESLIAAQKEMDVVTDKLPEGAADKPDAKLQAQLEGIAKKNGFADMNDYGAVYDNVSMVISGIDPKTKAFTEPPEMLKKQIAMVQADAKIPAKDKKGILAEMTDAMKTAKPVEFPANVELVTKNYDKLSPLFQDE